MAVPCESGGLLSKDIAGRYARSGVHTFFTGGKQMHIPDNYLSPQTCAVLTAVMVPAWAVSIHKIRKELPKEKVAMMGAAAALSFIGMMFNVPLPGGTTGHAVGGTLAAILLGPYAACISISTALLLQALLFGDGGILAFGANCFNMALVLPFIGCALYRLLTRRAVTEKRRIIAAGVASYVGINAAALCAAIEFGIQPMLFRNAAGIPLYCPYGLSVSIPAMMGGHLTIFGIAEVVFTVLILAFCDRVGAADFTVDSGRSVRTASAGSPLRGVRKDSASGGRKLGVLIAVLIIFTPVGLLAEGTAWGEWSTEEVASAAGFTPAGMAKGFDWSALFPDYSVGSLPPWFGYVLSAVIGAAVLVILFKLFSQKTAR